MVSTATRIQAGGEGELVRARGPEKTGRAGGGRRGRAWGVLAGEGVLDCKHGNDERRSRRAGGGGGGSGREKNPRGTPQLRAKLNHLDRPRLHTKLHPPISTRPFEAAH